MERTLLITCRCLSLFAVLVFAIVLFGCSTPASYQPFVIRFPGQTKPDESAENAEEKDSRALASLQLTNQGRILLENGKPDDAISVLERSIGLDPNNGQSCYWLAEAWLLKGNPAQAREFNRLADLYLRDDRGWMARVVEQRTRINEHSPP